MSVEELLTMAGERWRAEQPPPGDYDLIFTRSRRVWPALAAAAAAAVIVAGVTLLPREPARPATTPAPPPSTLLTDGMTVRVDASALVVPGKPVRLCWPGPEPAIGRPVPDCGPSGITVTGLDPARLTDRQEGGGVLRGNASITGVYRDGVIAVTEQRPPGTSATPPPDLPVPCAAPPGGWRPTSTIGNEVYSYLEAHAAEVTEPRMGYPDGPPTGPTNGPGYAKPGVFVVEVVTSDVDRVRADLTALYSGNLCVVAKPGALSRSEVRARWSVLEERLRPLLSDLDSGIYEASSLPDGRGAVGVVRWDERTYRLLEAVGLDQLEVTAWIRPVR